MLTATCRLRMVTNTHVSYALTGVSQREQVLGACTRGKYDATHCEFMPILCSYSQQTTPFQCNCVTDELYLKQAWSEQYRNVLIWKDVFGKSRE